MEKYCYVITEKRDGKIKYLGLYGDDNTAREAFLELSKEYGKKECDEIYNIISFINIEGCDQIIAELKPSELKWYLKGDKEF